MAKPRGRPKKVKKQRKLLPETPVKISVEDTDISLIKEPRIYFISLTFGDKVYEGSGTTLLDALKAVPVPVKIVSKGLLKVTDGEKKFEQMWVPVRIKRLFRPLSQATQAKMLEYLLK